MAMCLLHKHLSLGTQQPQKKPGMAVCSCNPSTGEAETRRSLELLASLAQSGTAVSVRDAISKTKVKSE